MSGGIITNGALIRSPPPPTCNFIHKLTGGVEHERLRCGHDADTRRQHARSPHLCVCVSFLGLALAFPVREGRGSGKSKRQEAVASAQIQEGQNHVSIGNSSRYGKSGVPTKTSLSITTDRKCRSVTGMHHVRAAVPKKFVQSQLAMHHWNA